MSVQLNSQTPSYGIINSIYRVLSSRIYSIFYDCLSKCTGNLELAKQYRDLSNYYWIRSSSLIAYDYFGDDLLLPGTNFEKATCVTQQLNLEKLAKIAIKARSILSGKFVLGSNYSSERSTGVCLGSTLSFISKYFKCRNQCGNCLNTVLYAGSKLQEGVSNKTAMIHRLQYNLTTAPEFHQNDNARYDCFMRLMDDKVKLTTSTIPLQKSEIQPLLNRISDGVYLVSLKGTAGSRGHTVVYIKENGEEYLFDPNLGTVKASKGLACQYLSHSMELVGCDRLEFYKASSTA